MLFYVGLHEPAHARHFARAFISVNRLRRRKAPFPAQAWIMDSGAFTEIAAHGHYRHDVAHYAADIVRWRDNGGLVCAVAQDWMCEPWIVRKTGLTVAEHQRRTIDRYDALMEADTGVAIMPVLQGFDPDDYRRHIAAYGDRLTHGAYVGVGSVCKRNGDPAAILAVLDAIHADRPDLRLHGFGLKATSLMCRPITARLHSADSMAWSFAERRRGSGRQNDWTAAREFEASILAGQGRQKAVQMALFGATP